MLGHGFYRNQQELNRLSFPLILLLDGSNDIYLEDDNFSKGSIKDDESNLTQLRYKFSKENEIILKSKKIQCDCLIQISQMELDGRTELVLAKLKHDLEKAKARGMIFNDNNESNSRK